MKTEKISIMIRRISEMLVDKPDAIRLSEETRDNTTILVLSVDKADVGKVIGKQGRTANAIRTVLAAASGKTQERYMIEIVD